MSIEIKNKFSVSDIIFYHHYFHKSDYVFSGHRHDGFELNVILDGEMEITSESSIYTLKKDSAFIIPPYSFHQNRVSSPDGAQMIVVSFKTADIENFNTPVFFTLDEDTKKIFEIFCEHTDKYSEFEGENLKIINESEIKLLEIFFQYCTHIEKKSANLLSDDSIIYNKAVNYMLKNINTKLSADKIAAECNVCKTKLENVFSYFTARGCMTYFNELKMDRAKKLLSEGKNCAYVSDFFGFSSQAYFSKVFKKTYGYLPSKEKGVNISH